MRYARPKSKKRRICIVVTAVLFALSAGIVAFSRKYVNPVLFELATSKVQSQTYRAINNAVASVINGNVVYTDLVSVVRDSAGDIAMLQTNSIRVNALARAAATMSQQNIERIGEQGLKVPVGSLSGVPLLSGRGPNVEFHIIPVGSVECQFLSEFHAAGINQTRHKIYITITANVSIIFPGAHKTVETITQMLITECILIGKVPDTYLNSDKLDESLNLVPNR